jgi:hypothetical protein
MSRSTREERRIRANETVKVLFDIGGSASPGSTTSEKALDLPLGSKVYRRCR